MEKTCSAKKLYSLLTEAKESNETNIMQVWSKLFGGGKTYVIEDKITQIFALIKEVKEDIQRLETNNPNKYITAINNIQHVLMTRPLANGDWKDVKNAIREDWLNLVDACGDLMISQSYSYRKIDLDELKQAEEKINDVKSEIKGNKSLDVADKLFLLSELRKIAVGATTGVKAKSE
jgi:hypothetical protein